MKLAITLGVAYLIAVPGLTDDIAIINIPAYNCPATCTEEVRLGWSTRTGSTEAISPWVRLGSRANGSVLLAREQPRNSVDVISPQNLPVPLFNTPGLWVVSMIQLRNGDYLALTNTQNGSDLVRLSESGAILANYLQPGGYNATQYFRAFDLAADQCTAFLVGYRMRRFDICRGIFLSDFGTVPAASNGAEWIGGDVQIIPDGGVLVSELLGPIKRLDSFGTIVHTYGAATGGFGLDPTGTAFWAHTYRQTSAGAAVPGLARIDIATGSELEFRANHPPPGALPPYVESLEVRNGWRAAVNGAAQIPALSPIALLMLAASLAVAGITLR